MNPGVVESNWFVHTMFPGYVATLFDLLFLLFSPWFSNTSCHIGMLNMSVPEPSVFPLAINPPWSSDEFIGMAGGSNVSATS